MKKIPLLFLISLIIFAGFIIVSLAKNNPSPTTSINIPIPTTAPVNTPTTNPSVCIVTVNGQRYDLTQFQYQHSGGNIFTCGTDMSAVFQNQHSQRYLNMMRAYLVP